jgi:hypothetical protein
MSNKALETIIREKIKVADGKQFQQLFWDIMILRYSDLQTPRMQHDLGNDGYSIKEKTFFACNAPESVKYDNANTVDKIDKDYKSFCDNWKSKNAFDKWFFVTKDNLMGQPHQALVDLNGNGDGVQKGNWGIEQIVREALCLEKADISRIFQLDGTYFQEAINEEKDFGIISEVFEFIFASKIPQANNDAISQADGYVNLSEKLTLNFTEKELESAREMVVRNWERKALVERYLMDENERNPGRIDALVDMMQSDFREIKDVQNHNTPVDSVRVIEVLAKRYLDGSKQSNPDYVACSRSIVLYLFELCFLGKKTDRETDKNVNVFEK